MTESKGRGRPKSPDPRVSDTISHSHQHGWRVRYVVDGKEYVDYFPEKIHAEARQRDLQRKFAGEVGTSDPTTTPPVDSRAPVTSDDLLRIILDIIAKVWADPLDKPAQQQLQVISNAAAKIKFYFDSSEIERRITEVERRQDLIAQAEKHVTRSPGASIPSGDAPVPGQPIH